MKPPIETIRLSQQAKDKLIYLKKVTGIEQWNILCRWALIKSISMEENPPSIKVVLNSSVEIQWKVFSGVYNDVYISMVNRCAKRHGVNDLSRFFIDHLHNGIKILSKDDFNFKF